jgi:nucleoside-diphosphate-sugar epimerase
LIHGNDVSRAVVRIIESSEASRGMVFNLSRRDGITVGQYLKDFCPKGAGKRIRVLFLPKFVWLAAAGVMDLALKLLKKGSGISRHRIDYWYCGSRIDPHLIQNKLGWQPKKPHIKDALRNQTR